MGAPILSVIAVVAGILFFLLGFVELSTCAGNAILLFAIGVFLVGSGVALVGGISVFAVSAILGIVLLIISYSSGHGLTGCGF